MTSQWISAPPQKKVLNGKYRHHCPDWDFLAIDEFCPEFEACLCFRQPLPDPPGKEGADHG